MITQFKHLVRVVGLLGVTIAISTNTPAFAVSFQVNPSVVGAPQPSLTADVVDFSYTATVNQQAPAGVCSTAAPCTFQETGTVSFSQFRQGFLTPVINDGLNETPGYTLTGQFTGSGTAVPFGDGIRATFNDFDISLFANNTTLVAQSTGLISGQANVFGPSLAKGDFHVVVQFDPVGGFFSGPFVFGLNTADFAGNNFNITGVSLGSFTGGRIEGSGQMTIGVIPEPTTLLLIGSGLAGLGLLRRCYRT
ncbi:MAG: hypothetical protein C4293_11850 [Nitrospiraceae bacterium]